MSGLAAVKDDGRYLIGPDELQSQLSDLQGKFLKCAVQLVDLRGRPVCVDTLRGDDACLRLVSASIV